MLETISTIAYVYFFLVMFITIGSSVGEDNWTQDAPPWLIYFLGIGIMSGFVMFTINLLIELWNQYA